MLSSRAAAAPRAVSRLASRLAPAGRRFSTQVVDEPAEGVRQHPAMASSLTAIGTRDIFDADHDMFRELARSFFENEVAPFHAEWEAAGEVPRELWTKAGELGLLSNMVPEEYGGLGLDCKYPAIMWEEQSYSGCTGPGFAMCAFRDTSETLPRQSYSGCAAPALPCTLTSSRPTSLSPHLPTPRHTSPHLAISRHISPRHSDIVAPYITNYGTEEQKSRILPKLVSGEWIGALARATSPHLCPSLPISRHLSP